MEEVGELSQLTPRPTLQSQDKGSLMGSGGVAAGVAAALETLVGLIAVT